MKRRKLAIGDAPHQQFQCLKQIPSLSNSDCRQVIDLLRHDGKGKTTCWHANVSHRTSNPLLRHLELPSTVGSVEKIWHMDFVRLVQAKVDSCPFFNESLSLTIGSQKFLITIDFIDSARNINFDLKIDISRSKSRNLNFFDIGANIEISILKYRNLNFEISESQF